jgi:transposase
MKVKAKSITFKPYTQDQLQFLPPSLDELIPSNHLVRLVNHAIDRMNIDDLIESYKGGGTSSYHPKMLLKVIIYAYTQRIYSSRRIAKALRENIHFMWLSGGNRPDFRTINRFRSSRLKGRLEEVFSAVVELLLEAGLIDFRDYFLDGTKIEANANKYSFVWGKATKKFKARLQQQLKELFKHIEETNHKEQARYKDRDLAELGEDADLSSEYIEEKLKGLEERLNKETDNKDLRKAVKKIKEDYLPRQKKYESQEKILQGRNSYSKTDPDATFMRMKEDHMRNGQLKAGYNLQMGTEKQFILGYSLHQKTTDTSLLIPHLDHLQQQMGRLPDRITADAGYGSEENYDYLESKGIQAYVKYNNYHYEKKRSFKKKVFRVENFPYDPETDSYKCPAGQRLKYLQSKFIKTRNGYRSSRHIYQAEGCSGCSLRSLCHKSKYNRRIEVSHRLNHYRKKARDLLDSKQGLIQRSRRPADVEAVFGQIKNNRHFRRFTLRSLEKVTIEFGLIAMAHNLMKWQAKLTDIANISMIYFFEILKMLRKRLNWLQIDKNICFEIVY